MHLDKHGLPVQSDGDANDQLQRVAMIALGHALLGRYTELTALLLKAVRHDLQPAPGVFTRFPGGNPNNVSADQLISALCLFVGLKDLEATRAMFWATVKRFGFAQNYKDGLNSDTKSKIPDFMLLRALPLFARAAPSILRLPMAYLCDSLLVLSALASCFMPVWRDGEGFTNRSLDDVDDNLVVMTLAVCYSVAPTFLSRLAYKIFMDHRMPNHGSINYGCSPVHGSLRWYHRARNGGNPEIAELWVEVLNLLDKRG